MVFFILPTEREVRSLRLKVNLFSKSEDFRTEVSRLAELLSELVPEPGILVSIPGGEIYQFEFPTNLSVEDVTERITNLSLNGTFTCKEAQHDEEMEPG